MQGKLHIAREFFCFPVDPQHFYSTALLFSLSLALHEFSKVLAPVLVMFPRHPNCGCAPVEGVAWTVQTLKRINWTLNLQNSVLELTHCLEYQGLNLDTAPATVFFSPGESTNSLLPDSDSSTDSSLHRVRGADGSLLQCRSICTIPLQTPTTQHLVIASL